MFRLRAEIMRRDHEHGFRFGIYHVDDPEIPPRTRLAQSHPRTVATRPILERAHEDVPNLLLGHAVAPYVELSGFLIEVESDLQTDAPPSY